MRIDLPVAVVGAGFSGTLLAVNLLRLGQRVVLIERDRERVAKGQAFGTRRPEHLLNVRAANMSAYPDDPDHFLRWMGFSTTDQANRFVPRLTYGQYLLEQLLDALAKAPKLGSVRAGDVARAAPGGASVMLRMADGEQLECRTAVLALGNFPPSPIPGLEGLPSSSVVDNPWDPQALAGAADLCDIVLIGTGLTAIDVALSLKMNGFEGRISAISRRGLKPRAHAEEGPAVGPVSIPQSRGAHLLADIRRRADEIGWRGAIDELRPHTQQLWRAHSTAEQARFLRHARSYWDVHRHRLSPAAASQIAELEQAGRLEFIAGRIAGAEIEHDRARLLLRRRGTTAIEPLQADRIINCTGPRGDLSRSEEGLLSDLFKAGQIRSDPHHVGLDIDRLGRLLDRSGQPSDRLFAVGPITKGEAWEMIAVPDIRRQVWDLARYLADAHWVGGEGL
ncbi:MAG: FAD/NAD(P)-binding protein [Novosphingobium sp.]